MKSIIFIWLFQIALGIAALVGEIKCIIHLCECDFEPSYKAEIIYAVGSVTGAGAIIGYFDLGE